MLSVERERLPVVSPELRALVLLAKQAVAYYVLSLSKEGRRIAEASARPASARETSKSE